MRNFFNNLAYKTSAFMQGRNGVDNLNRLLSGITIVLLILSCFVPYGRYVLLLALIVEGYYLFRVLSKNLYKRQQENIKYMSMTTGIRKKFTLFKNMFRDNGVYKYYRCPNCHSYVRIRKPPRGKKIAVSCYKCHNEFIKRT